MWQIYAYTAMDIVRERQREAREASRRGRSIDFVEVERSGAGRRVAARALAVAGRATGALAAAFDELAARLDRPAAGA